MADLLISDLHLGSRSGADLLRSDLLRGPLLERVAAADRIVLLGDIVELRHGPAPQALAAAEPFLKALGQAAAGRQVVLCPGNHDHALIAPALAKRVERGEQLGLEVWLRGEELTPPLRRIWELLSPAPLAVCYPGLFLRDDVYATHGHYLDCHVTIPTLERLGLGAMGRVVGRPLYSLRTPSDYEAVTSPLYTWIDAVARQGQTNAALDGSITVRAWHALGGGDSTHSLPNGGAGRGRTLLGLAGRQALRRGFPLLVNALNRAGLGPLKADISAAELRRAGLRAAGEVASRLGLGDRYLVFGHTHRAGPLPHDDPHEWVGPAGTKLVNTGCWTFERAFLRSLPAPRNPYWPGSCVVVEESGPPRVERLLDDVAWSDLEQAAAAAVGEQV